MAKFHHACDLSFSKNEHLHGHMTINKVPSAFTPPHFHIFISYPNNALLATAATAEFQHCWPPHHSPLLPPTLFTPRAMSLAPSMPLPSLKDVGILTPPRRPCHNNNDYDNTMLSAPTTGRMPHQQKGEQGDEEEGVGQHEAAKSLLLPSLRPCLWPYCKPICVGNTPAQGSVIPTTAPVAPVSTTGQYDTQYLHAAPSTTLTPLIGGYILPAVTLSMRGSVKSTYHPLQTHFGVILSAAVLSMGGGVTSTRHPLQMHFGIILSTVALSMGGGVNIHMLPPRTHFGIIFSMAASSMEGSVISTHHPLRSCLLALFRSASSDVSTPSCCFEFQFPSCTSYFQLNIFMLYNFGDLD